MNRILSSRIFILLIGFFSIINLVNSQGLNLPVNAPSWQIMGGYFAKYFENIFWNNKIFRLNYNNSYDLINSSAIFGKKVCPDNEAIVGFSYDGNIIPTSIANITNGIPICAKVTAIDGNASWFTWALVGKDNYIPVYTNSGRLLNNSIITQNINAFNSDNSGATINWHLIVGKEIASSNSVSYPEYGSRLFFEWATHNTDLMYFYRYNKSAIPNSSWLRTVIGDDYNVESDGFQLWTSNPWDNRFSKNFNPFFTVTANWKMVLSTNPSHHDNINNNSPSLFVNWKGHFTDNLSTSWSFFSSWNITTQNGNFLAPNWWITVKNDIRTTGGNIYGNNFYANGKIYSTGWIETKWNISASGSLLIGSGAIIRGPITTSEIIISGSGSGIKPPAGTGTGRILVTIPSGTGVTTSWNTFTQIANSNPIDFSTAMKNMFPSLCKATGSGVGNTCYWIDSMQKNTTGNENEAYWIRALRNNTTWTHNVAIGNESLENNTVWNRNIAVGWDSLRANVSWRNNTAIGADSGKNLISGNNNIAIGENTNFVNTTGSNQLNIGNWIYGNNWNIGIWVTSPRTKLAVQWLFRIISDLSSANHSTIQLYDSDNSTGYAFWKDPSNKFFLNYDNRENSAQRNILTALSNGNIGIWNNNPQTKLHISNHSDAWVSVSLLGDIIRKPWLKLHVNNDTNHSSYWYSVIDARWKIFSIRWIGINSDQTDWWNGTYIFNVDLNNKRVGIWTTSPSEKLEVVGNIKANAYLYTSDERFKTNISTIDSALDKISSLRGVNFDWRDTGRKTIGFIAQEVEKIIPEIVHTDSNGYKSVEYANITAILVEAIKEQQNQISNLQNRLDNQEKLLLDLQNQILEFKNQK